MENVPMPISLEQEFIQGNASEKVFPLLKQAVMNLKSADIITIPCNSVHVFIERLRKISSNILSITEETAKECNSRGFKKVGILATKTTVQKNLHKKELGKFNVELIVPTKKEQETVNQTIINLLRGIQKDDSDLQKIISSLKNNGAEAIILGCTDLQLIVKNSSLPVIDTLNVLETRLIDFLTNNKAAGEIVCHQQI
jgi:aspartate racemase